MKDLNQAMKKLQESKKVQSDKLAKLVKESTTRQNLDKIAENESIVEPENKEEIFDGKFNYKVTLDNGKTITATCSKENLADAKEYFLNKIYMNTKTNERAKVVNVEDIKEGEYEEIKNEAKELEDNDPALKKPYESEANKELQNAAKKDAKIVAEEFGNKSKELNDNDPAQNKPFETETKKEIDNATKGNRINNKIDESKKLEESATELSNDQKLEKAKELVEVIFSMETLDETRHAAKKELRDLVFPQKSSEETQQLPEKKIVKESIFDNDEEVKNKEDRLAQLRTQLEMDGDQLADDEKEAIKAEIDSLEAELYENKNINESTDEYEYVYTPDELLNICNNDEYNFDEDHGTLEDLENELKNIERIESQNEITSVDYVPGWDSKVKTVLKDGREFVTDESEVSIWEAIELTLATEIVKESKLNEGVKGKTLEVIYTDKNGEEKVTHFECDKEYELDGEQIREAIKSSDNNIVDIIKINESKELTEEIEDEETTECNCNCCVETIDDETFTEAFTKFVKENYKNAKEFKLENVVALNNGDYKFECKLVFNSGKIANVNLISNATLKEGKSLIRFYENKVFKHLDENKSIMTATVKLENKVLSCESLRYSYRVALKENKVALVKGIVK